MAVHNHGTEQGAGLACPESLIGECLITEGGEMIEALREECGRLEREVAELRNWQQEVAQGLGCCETPGQETGGRWMIADAIQARLHAEEMRAQENENWERAEVAELGNIRLLRKLVRIRRSRDRFWEDAQRAKAERDGLLAMVAEVRSIASKRSRDPQLGFGGPPDDMPLSEDYEAFGEFYVAEEIRAALTTSPAQSLANLQAALVLEYIDSPEHAESLSEQKHKVFQSIRDASDFERGDNSTGILDALWIDVDKFNALEDREDVDWVRFTATGYAESLADVASDSRNDALVDAAAWARTLSGESADAAADYIDEMCGKQPEATK